MISLYQAMESTGCTEFLTNTLRVRVVATCFVKHQRRRWEDSGVDSVQCFGDAKFRRIYVESRAELTDDKWQFADQK